MSLNLRKVYPNQGYPLVHLYAYQGTGCPHLGGSPTVPENYHVQVKLYGNKRAQCYIHTDSVQILAFAAPSRRAIAEIVNMKYIIICRGVQLT